MKVCVKYFDSFCHRNPLHFNRLQIPFVSMACLEKSKVCRTVLVYQKAHSTQFSGGALSPLRLP